MYEKELSVLDTDVALEIFSDVVSEEKNFWFIFDGREGTFSHGRYSFPSDFKMKEKEICDIFYAEKRAHISKIGFEIEYTTEFTKNDMTFIKAFREKFGVQIPYK